MDEAARREWLAVARVTLKHLPADLLRQGCGKARQTCDHPAKIVPAILADVADQMRWRRDDVRPAPVPPERQLSRGETALSPAEIEETNAIMARVGVRTRYHPDGSRYEVDAAAEAAVERGPLRKPTRADYLELGVDPEVLDRMDLEDAD